MQALAFGRLDDVVAAVAGDHEAEVERDGLCSTRCSAKAVQRALRRQRPPARRPCAAQMKSLIEMPPTEWVLKRTTQRL